MTVPRQGLRYKYTSAPQLHSFSCCAYAPYRSLNLTTHICHTAVLYRQRNYRGISWIYPRHDPTLEGTLRNNPSPPPGSTLNIKSSMSCFPHTLLRTNVTLHVIRRKETTPVSYQTNEPMCTLTLTHYATASKKQLRSLSTVVDPSLLYVALNDESGFEPSVYLLLENEA